VFSPDNLQWVIPEGNSSYSTETNPQINFLSNGSYSVTLIVSNADVSDTLSRIIDIDGDCPIVIPNVFTPNQD
jgi:PKD repeat protein